MSIFRRFKQFILHNVGRRFSFFYPKFHSGNHVSADLYSLYTWNILPKEFFDDVENSKYMSDVTQSIYVLGEVFKKVADEKGYFERNADLFSDLFHAPKSSEA
ncbi:hypothetical protein [Xanthomarina sp. GH4-25]|uniref:hypothetical protein n=1 Tax=Xanthomarina sp. GH4-25 TaxID=3349335 RepID=UPI003877C306